MENQKETQKNPQYKYASTREKLCFGIGAIGKDAICNLVGAFLMLYFTDTLYLAPAFVGVLFFVARIWDAINDPMMGMIVDNTHTRFGKFRIWLGVTTCCMADVIDYGEVKFGVRNESVTCSAQTFLMKAAMAAAGGLTGIGLQIVGYNAKAVTQSAATVMGIRVLMIVIPIILAFASFGIYKKYYTLKGEKMEEITRKVNEMHAKKQTA